MKRKGKEGMLMNRKHGYQMSDSLIIMILLNLSGGTQDACSYFLRDHVFANAQTGNIVLMGCYLISEDLRDSIRYFLPVFCFALGVLTACFIRSKCRHTGKIHWRHLVLVMEILLLFVVGFLPPQVNWLANALTSFACAMQVQSFRTVSGSAYASTMCIGNLRSGMDHLYRFITGKKKEDCRVVVNGAGSAGVAITKLLLTYGFPHITMCDINGIISKDSPDLNWMQKEMTKVTNLEGRIGLLADALKGADIFVGVSAPNIVTPEMVASMNQDAILFAMANPVPEIMPDLAKAAGAKVVGTGRSDFPNQVNNVVAFPGIFKGALEGRATQITEEMKLAAANAIAGLVPEEELNENNILPEAFDPRVTETVSKAIKDLI